MKDYSVLYIVADMGEIEDKKFLYKVGMFLKENDEIKLIVEDKNGIDYILMFIPKYKIISLKKLFSSINWFYVIENITSNCLFENKLPDFFSNGFTENRYTELYENYRKQNLSKDDILDIILKKGFDGLNKLEREIITA